MSSKILYFNYSHLYPVTGVGKVVAGFKSESDYESITPFQIKSKSKFLFYVNRIIFHFYYSILMPIIFYLGRYERYIEFNMVKPLFIPTSKVIYFVHDLAFLKNPEHLTGRSLSVRKKFIKALKYNNSCLCNSENTKNDIVKLLKLESKNIYVCLLGFETKLKLNKSELSRFKSRDKRSYLYVGTIEPRKKLYELLRAFKKSSEKDAELILAGSYGWKNESTINLAKEINNELGYEAVKFTGYISNDELSKLYSCCQYFVYPCDEEGFGIPLLEALYFRIPAFVKYSDVSQEVLGDNALYLNEFDDFIKVFQGKFDLQIDDDKAIEHLKAFTWDNFNKSLKDGVRKIG